MTVARFTDMFAVPKLGFSPFLSSIFGGALRSLSENTILYCWFERNTRNQVVSENLAAGPGHSIG